MRQTGRTTRIVDFIIDQLHSNGRCISTDHTAFEYQNGMVQATLHHLIELVERRINLHSRGTNSVESSICKLNGIYVVDFTLRTKTK